MSEPIAKPVTLPRPVRDVLPDKLPAIYRLQSIARLPIPGGQTLSRATLFHECASLSVEWLSRHVDIRLTQGSLVSIRWLGQPVCLDGHVRIARLVLIERPEADLNLLALVPPAWVRERELNRPGFRRGCWG